MLQQWTVPNQGPHKGHTSHWSVIVRLGSLRNLSRPLVLHSSCRGRWMVISSYWRAEEASNCPHKLTKTAEPWLGGGAAFGRLRTARTRHGGWRSLLPLRVSRGRRPPPLLRGARR